MQPKVTQETRRWQTRQETPTPYFVRHTNAVTAHTSAERATADEVRRYLEQRDRRAAA